MRILIVNDDGINGPGVWALTEELVDIAEVHVVVPDREQSGIGTAVSLHRPLRANRVPSWRGVESAYTVDGTPADCVILGLRSLVKEPVDMVISGINEGANLGNDVLISGTVGAALQGFFSGVPSIAVSVTAVENPKFGPAAGFTGQLVKQLMSSELPKNLFLNVNVPNRPLEQINGVCFTRFAERTYADTVDEKTDSRGKPYYWILRGTPEWEVEEGTDIWALRNKFISVSHLHVNLAHSSDDKGLFQVFDETFQALKSRG